MPAERKEAVRANKAEEGRQAYKDGLPRHDNPYPLHSMKYWQWSSGWLDERAFRPRARPLEGEQ